MVKVKINDLLLILQQMKFDGYDTVNISELDADDDVPATINLCCEDEIHCEDYEYLYNIDSDDIKSNINLSKYSTYTPNELDIICCALDVSHQYFKQRLNDVSLSADERSEFSSTFKEHEALFNIFLKVVN